jgi:3-dehydroquinate dehydratase type I
VIAQVCVSILPKTIPQALQLIEKSEDAKADLIEVRLDHIENHAEIVDLTSHSKTPKIATIRPVNSRGMFSGTEKERKTVLLNAAKSEFEYIDIDLSAPELEKFISEVKDRGVKTIISFHDFSGTSNVTKLTKILEHQISRGADVCKIATTANSIEDNLTILNFLSTTSSKARIVCFAMGNSGKISRLLSPLFGGFFTFASLEKGSETAAGQMSIQEMKRTYELLGLNMK